MNLNKPKNISPQILTAYKFLRKFQISRIISDPVNLNNVLNDYILTMNKNYNFYDDRINVNIKNKKKYKCKDHIENFRKFKKNEILSKTEFNLVKKFYEELLNHVDTTLNKTFYLGTIFSDKDIKTLINTESPYEFSHNIEQKNIIIDIDGTLSEKEQENADILPWDLIDWNFFVGQFCKLAEKHKYGDIVSNMDFPKDLDTLFFCNKKRQFKYICMHDILDSCSENISYKINFDESNSKNLYIDMYRFD